MAWKEVLTDIWKPEKDGDSVQGVYVTADTEPETNNSFSNKYYLETSDHQVVMIWGSAVLDERMKLISFGTKVKIEYKGQTQNKKGQPLNLYKVYTDYGDSSDTAQ